MFVDIIRPPAGEAPQWVREAWVGLRLPLAQSRVGTWVASGVVTGPKSFTDKLWARLTGRAAKASGYAVDAGRAVDILAGASPEAADWWRQNAAQLLTDGQCFLFDAAACRPAADAMTPAPPA